MPSTSLWSILKIIALISLTLCSLEIFAQRHDSTFFFRGSIGVTQNGFSLIPSFSLGKPALNLEPAIGNKRWSFEPQFRFALEGKPWQYIFLFKYKFILKPRFTLQAGVHFPTIIFSTQQVTRNGITEDVLISQRYSALELTNTYRLSDNVNLELYILRGHGWDPEGIQNTTYVGLRSTITNINVTRRLYFKITPQIYFLQTDAQIGYYVTNTLALVMRDFPLSLQNIVYKSLQTEISGKTFDWNVSLVYSFDSQFRRAR